MKRGGQDKLSEETQRKDSMISGDLKLKVSRTRFYLPRKSPPEIVHSPPCAHKADFNAPLSRRNICNSLCSLARPQTTTQAYKRGRMESCFDALKTANVRNIKPSINPRLTRRWLLSDHQVLEASGGNYAITKSLTSHVAISCGQSTSETMTFCSSHLATEMETLLNLLFLQSADRQCKIMQL